MCVYENLKKLGLELPTAPPKGGIYVPAKEFSGNLVYISGCGPALNGNKIVGKLGEDFTTEQGYEYAKNCALNILAVLEAKIGDLNKVKSVVKILALVACANDFYEHPQVANGASQLLMDVFGEEIGTPSRSAIGTNALPGNMPVEIEAIFELV